MATGNGNDKSPDALVSALCNAFELREWIMPVSGLYCRPNSSGRRVGARDEPRNKERHDRCTDNESNAYTYFCCDGKPAD